MVNTTMTADDSSSKKGGGPKAVKAAKQPQPGIATRIRTFYHEVRVELEKVSWPSKEELKGMTGVVLLTLAVLGAIIGAYDWVFLKIVQLVLLLG
ncbi:MAG: hypothetical protein AMXMBFR84_47860 [Candidatus Hydrogenedentota bacterium]